MRAEAPNPAALPGSCGRFGTIVPPDAYLGKETDHNRLSVYLERRAETLAGTCAITVPNTHPILGGFGEVATRPGLRGSGIATRLCGRAVEEFRAASGQALFLGTSSPPVRRIYHRLGWRKLAGADVMANISSRDTPEAFLVDYFRTPGQATVVPATPAVRVPMIPLLHAPHDWQVLDANAGMYSTRYCVQYSCMGLYRRYLAAVAGGAGDWFCARTVDGRAVGLATVCRAGAACKVDAFAHPYFATVWPDLMAAAMQRAAAWGSTECRVLVCVEDEEKPVAACGTRFRRSGHGRPLHTGWPHRRRCQDGGRLRTAGANRSGPVPCRAQCGNRRDAVQEVHSAPTTECALPLT